MTARGPINPEVYRAAEYFTDGEITLQILRDVAAMEGLPLYVERKVEPVEEPAP